MKYLKESSKLVVLEEYLSGETSYFVIVDNNFQIFWLCPGS